MHSNTTEHERSVHFLAEMARQEKAVADAWEAWALLELSRIREMLGISRRDANRIRRKMGCDAATAADLASREYQAWFAQEMRRQEKAHPF